MPENTSQKAALRRALLANRQSIDPEVRRQWDAQISAKLVAWWEAHPAPTLGVYWPIRGEPDLRSAYTDLATRGAQLALPAVVARDAPLKFIAWTPGEEMAKDAFGVAIPADGVELIPSALLIPCVGFNEQYYRLGYGGGFYDRTLALSPRPRTVGIGYADTFVTFDADAHDIALDTVITERSAIDID